VSFGGNQFEVVLSPSGKVFQVAVQDVKPDRASEPSALTRERKLDVARQILDVAYGSVSGKFHSNEISRSGSRQQGLVAFDFRVFTSEIPVDALTGYGKLEFYADNGELIMIRMPEVPRLAAMEVNVSEKQARTIGGKAIQDLEGRTKFSEIAVTIEAIRLSSINPKSKLYKSDGYGLARKVRRVAYRATSKVDPKQSGLVAVLIDAKSGEVVRRDVFSML
jgi:hypothetical protein